MTSKLGCIGLAVDTGDQLDRLVAAVLPAADSLGRNGDLEVFRWQDPSGARLIIGIEDGERVDLLASFAGASGPVLAHLRPVAADATAADVVDRDGDQLARIAVELEQRRLLMAAPSAPSGPATLVALGTDVTVREDPDAVETFRSRAGPGSAQASAEAEADGPHARLVATVLRAERRTVEQTGQQFVVARVRTSGFELDVCLAASDHPALPTPGQIIAGTVSLVASLEQAPATHVRPGRKKYGWRRD